MEEFDKLCLDVMGRVPETNPDGTPWMIFAGEHTYTKQQVLDNWGKDMEMTNMIRKVLMHGQVFKNSNNYHSSKESANKNG